VVGSGSRISPKAFVFLDNVEGLGSHCELQVVQ
jgi:hypothetical protein